MTALEATAGDAPLPELRPELRLLEGAPGPGGERRWLIYDPLQHIFVQIDAAAHAALGHWRAARGTADLIARAGAASGVALDTAGVGQLVEFLQRHRLTMEPPSGGWRHLAAAAAAEKGSWLQSAIHNYLFFRLPLWRPQRLLERTLPAVRWLGSSAATAVLVLLGLVGLYLVSRQWDAFLATFAGFASWRGAMAIALVLALVKSAHELGHAWTAVRFGCRVPTIGIAFVVLAPMLYTDVTDAWRLTDRRRRLAIDSAGMRTELSIGAVALFLWSFLPDGELRSFAFLLSTTSLASTLAININPFMRFDGYYLLCETLAVENLQPRAFALASWHLRETLFGLGHPSPEGLSRRLRSTLVAYAYLTWVYRLVVFVGIAFVVYHYFFKLLGIVLFAIEIIYFILRPIWWEARMWWRLRDEILARRRWLVVAAALLLLIAALIVPWSTRVVVPAVVEAADLRNVHAVRPGRIVEVHVRHGRDVVAGEALVTLASPDIEREIELARTRLRLARLQHARRGADAADKESTLELESTVASLVARLDGLEKERADLVVRAPIDGRVMELNPLLHAGRWIGSRELIAVVGARGDLVARGYVAEADIERVSPGSPALFVPEHPHRPRLSLLLIEIAKGSAPHIEIADLASVHEGAISVTPDPKGRQVPTSAHYLVLFRVSGPGTQAEIAARGVALVEGQPESIVARVWRRTLQVLVRESGM